jgi:serine/threonine-protein kinase
LKIFKPVESDENAKFFARIQQEAITLANISHPNIVAVTDLGITGATPYIVQEFVEGLDLQELLRREGSFSESRCIKLSSQLCDGIAFLHGCGIVHRDIKPANVIVSKTEKGIETAKLIDLGIAGIAKQDKTICW